METKCCICGNKYFGWGNNPDGAAWKKEDGTVETPEFSRSDRCCEDCNSRYVIPGRLYRVRLREQKEIKD